MPVARIPLIGSFNQRTVDANTELVANTDQRFLNCTFAVVQNPVTGKASVYVEKRPGWGVDSLVAAGNISTGLIKTDYNNAVISAFGATNSTLYDGQVNIGTITGRAMYFTETLISTKGYVCIKSSDGSGWYYPYDAKDTVAYTADGNNSTTITDIKIGGVNSTAGLYPGQKLTAAANIVAGTRIVSVNSGAFTAVLDTATIDGAFSDLAITKEPIASIEDADFISTGTVVTAFVEMDGYLFYGNEDGYIYNSDLNSVIAWGANSRINPSMSADPPNALARHKNMVVAFGAASMEVFYNAGYATGSPITRAPQFFSKIGALEQRSVATLKDDIYYVASAKYGDVSVIRLRNLSPQEISTPTINKILGTISATGGYLYANAFELGGYGYVSIFCTNATEDVDYLLLETSEYLLQEDDASLLIMDADPGASSAFAHLFVYNVDLNVWSEWDSRQSTFIVGIGAGANNQVVATSRVDTGGKVFTISPASNSDIYTDDGSAYTMEVRTARMDMGTERRKFVTSIRLAADTQASGIATLECSDDDYQTWRTLGTFDMTSPNKRITRCGSYRGGRAYRLTHSDPTAFRAEALEIEYNVGSA